MFEFVHSFDADAMYVLNHWLPTSTDVFWLAVTKTITWIPLYVVMVERLFRRSAMDVFVKRLALVVLGVLLWDQGAELFKHWIARPRPCQTMEDLRVLAHCSPYGFFSAHAANAFGLAFLFRKWLHQSWFPVLLIIAVLQSFSRIHLGVHYPTDLLFGALWGFLVSFVLHKIEKTWS